jgi:hypothetical protein
MQGFLNFLNYMAFLISRTSKKGSQSLDHFQGPHSPPIGMFCELLFFKLDNIIVILQLLPSLQHDLIYHP